MGPADEPDGGRPEIDGQLGPTKADQFDELIRLVLRASSELLAAPIMTFEWLQSVVVAAS